MRKEAEDWLSQALAELKTAKDCLDSENFYATAFHAQQSFELALKAYYIDTQRKMPPKSHNLIGLVEELNLTQFLEIAREFAPVYMVSRYPDAAGGAPFRFYDRKKGVFLLKNAEEVVLWIKKSLC